MERLKDNNTQTCAINNMRCTDLLPHCNLLPNAISDKVIREDPFLIPIKETRSRSGRKETEGDMHRINRIS